MISARTLNTIEDYILQTLDTRQIQRLFEDNGIRKSWLVRINSKSDLVKAYRETLDTFFREESKLPYVAEAIRKIFESNDEEAGTRKRNELLELVKKDGYELIDGVLVGVDSSVDTVMFHSPTTSFTTLYTELKKRKNESTESMIGMSKDMLESLFKSLCDLQQVSYAKDEKFDSLVSKALSNFDFVTFDCTEEEKTENYIRQMVTVVALKINEMRNIHGHGHGKNEEYKPVDLETARLIANTAISIATYFIPRLNIKK